jgi:hypothetical protein
MVCLSAVAPRGAVINELVQIEKHYGGIGHDMIQESAMADALTLLIRTIAEH